VTDEDAPLSTIRPDTGERHERKYQSRNPFQVWVLRRFMNAVLREIEALQPDTVLDFGTGEGFFLQRLLEGGARPRSVLGIDLREDALRQARRRCPSCEFEQVDLLTWEHTPASFDLVIASEVLEHLEDPGRYLKKLVELSRGHLLLTVPFEPWFQILNLIRGRDIGRLGNHPEHVNRWGFRGFKRFVASHAGIESAYTVFPFTVARPRPDAGR
jgi:2-polyprenyl-3-methyl-5-hydroxy-6-metoxy-1,4-benzoquinol methylase